jgi:drug/metabolite transporter (DMT)-like permease
VALAGAILLVVFDTTETGQSNILYAIPVFIATMSYATSANIVKRFLQDAHPLAMGAVGFLFIGIPALIYLSSTDILQYTSNETFALSFWSVIILSVFGTVLASIGYYTLVQRTDPIFGSLVTYLIPIVAIIIGMLDGEKMLLHHYAGILLILAGIYLMNASFSNKNQLNASKLRR